MAGGRAAPARRGLTGSLILHAAPQAPPQREPGYREGRKPRELIAPAELMRNAAISASRRDRKAFGLTTEVHSTSLCCDRRAMTVRSAQRSGRTSSRTSGLHRPANDGRRLPVLLPGPFARLALRHSRSLGDFRKSKAISAWRSLGESNPCFSL